MAAPPSCSLSQQSQSPLPLRSSGPSIAYGPPRRSNLKKFPRRQLPTFNYINAMNLLPFENLPPYRPRSFVPKQIDLGDWNQIAPLFDKLEAQIQSAKTATDLEKWVIDSSELFAALDEES